MKEHSLGMLISPRPFSISRACGCRCCDLGLLVMRVALPAWKRGKSLNECVLKVNLANGLPRVVMVSFDLGFSKQPSACWNGVINIVTKSTISAFLFYSIFFIVKLTFRKRMNIYIISNDKTLMYSSLGLRCSGVRCVTWHTVMPILVD